MLKESTAQIVRTRLGSGRYTGDADRKEGAETAASHARERSIQKHHTQVPCEHAALTLEGS